MHPQPMSAPNPVGRARQAEHDDDKISVGKAAKLCGVDYDTFLRWIRKGVLAYERVGPDDSIRVRRGDVQLLIKTGS